MKKNWLCNHKKKNSPVHKATNKVNPKKKALRKRKTVKGVTCEAEIGVASGFSKVEKTQERKLRILVN